MKRVLLTGATGFIGRNCLSLLVERDFEVHAVSTHPIPECGSQIHWHQADLLDASQVKALTARVQATHLMHFAWYAVPGIFWESPENIRWVRSSLCLVEEFARHGGHRLVIAGTCAEYDFRYGFCSEEVTPLRPTTLYGACKHALQLIVSAFSRNEGLVAAWGRIFFLFGPHEHPDRLVASVIRSISRGEAAQCSHGNQVRDFLYVEDAADAFASLLDSCVSGPVNIASGKPIAVRDVICAIAMAKNRPDLVRLGALPTREGEPPLMVANIRRLKEEVGWSPKYDLDLGLRKTIEWWAQSQA